MEQSTTAHPASTKYVIYMMFVSALVAVRLGVPADDVAMIAKVFAWALVASRPSSSSRR